MKNLVAVLTGLTLAGCGVAAPQESGVCTPGTSPVCDPANGGQALRCGPDGYWHGVACAECRSDNGTATGLAICDQDTTGLVGDDCLDAASHQVCDANPYSPAETLSCVAGRWQVQAKCVQHADQKYATCGLQTERVCDT